MIEEWNGISNEVVDVESLESSRRMFDKFRVKDESRKYNIVMFHTETATCMSKPEGLVLGYEILSTSCLKESKDEDKSSV